MTRAAIPTLASRERANRTEKKSETMRLDVIRTCRPTQRALKKENETLARQLDAALDENAKMLRKLHNARLQWQLEAAKRKLVQLHHKRQTLLAEKGQLEVVYLWLKLSLV